jgi:hypothetical protein
MGNYRLRYCIPNAETMNQNQKDHPHSNYKEKEKRRRKKEGKGNARSKVGSKRKTRQHPIKVQTHHHFDEKGGGQGGRC